MNPLKPANGPGELFSEEESLKPQILALIRRIEACISPDSDFLTDILRNSGLTTDDLSAYTQFEHHPAKSYGRTILYTGRNFTIYLMSWNQHDYTAIHSHGQCDWGVVLFFMETAHRLYKVDGSEVHLASKSRIPAGTIAPVNGSLIHAMGNDSPAPIITLHIYGSNTSQSNANTDSFVYELEKNVISVTEGEAYLNLDSGSVKEQFQGISTDAGTRKDYFEMILPFYRRIGHNEMITYLEESLSATLRQTP